MNRFGKSLLLAMMVALLAIPSAFADTIGVVNVRKLMENYQESKTFQSENRVREAKLRQMEADFNKQLAEAREANSKNPLSVTQLEKDLTKKLQDEFKAYQDWAIAQNKSLNTRLTAAIQEVAKVKNVDVILNQETVLKGGIDITNDVLVRLNAK